MSMRSRCVAGARAIALIHAMSDLHENFSKPEPDPMVHVRVPRSMLAEIEREAARSERTISGQVRYLIAVGMEAQHSAAAA